MTMGFAGRARLLDPCRLQVLQVDESFYRRHGFTEVRRTDGADNEEHVPDVRMVWGAHPERLESSA